MDKVKKHASICKELNDLYARKNKDYGDSFGRGFREYGMLMPLIRLEDKFNRLKQIILSGNQSVKDESVQDTLADLANYAIMTLLETDEQEEKKR